MYNEKTFIQRLTQLRQQKGVSARDMSLSIGQNPSYINNIENGKALPSMMVFFYICDYFNISPKEFFDSATNPKINRQLLHDIECLSPKQTECLSYLIHCLSSGEH